MKVVWARIDTDARRGKTRKRSVRSMPIRGADFEHITNILASSKAPGERMVLLPDSRKRRTPERSCLRDDQTIFSGEHRAAAG
jgi:hypothetical protein